jgi:hypothetical protein
MRAEHEYIGRGVDAMVFNQEVSNDYSKQL